MSFVATPTNEDVNRDDPHPGIETRLTSLSLPIAWNASVFRGVEVEESENSTTEPEESRSMSYIWKPIKEPILTISIAAIQSIMKIWETNWMKFSSIFREREATEDSDGLFVGTAAPDSSSTSSSGPACCLSMETVGTRIAQRVERDGSGDNDKDGGGHDSDIFFPPSHLLVPLVRESDHSIEVNEDYHVSQIFTSDWEEKEDLMTLNIHMGRVRLDRHPKILSEERQAIELISLYKKWKELQERGDIQYHSIRLSTIIAKLNSLRLMLSSATTPMEPSSPSIHKLYDEMLHILSKMVSIEHELYSVHVATLKKWRAVCESRVKQGFQCTSLTLCRREGTDDVHVDSTQEDMQNLDQVVNSMEAILEWLSPLLSSPESIGERDFGGEPRVILSVLKAIRENVSKRCDLFVRQNEDDISIHVRPNKHANNARDVDFDLEQKRRDLVMSEKYVASLFLDGEKIGTSDPVSLQWPSWELNFEKQFRCQVSNFPSLVFIEINRKKFGSLVSEPICTIFPAVPCGSKSREVHHSLDLITPITQAYHFDGRSHHQEGQFSGSMMVSVKWEKPYLVSEDAKSKVWNRIDHIRPNQIQQRLIGGESSGYPLSVSMTSLEDPFHVYGAVAQSSLNEHSMDFHMKGTRYSFLNPLRFQEPVRHHLIKQREATKDSSCIIPLSESDVSIEVAKDVIADRKSRKRSDDDLVDAACQQRRAARSENVRRFISLSKHRCFNDVSRQAPHNRIVFEDVVYDSWRIRAQDPPEAFNFIWGKMFPPRKRTLYPQKAKIPLERNGTKLKQTSHIVISVLGAKDVPIREEMRITKASPFLVPPPSIQRIKADLSSLSLRSFPESRSLRRLEQAETDQVTSSSMLNSFVRVNFGQNSYQTRTEKKDVPAWKQVIHIPLPSDENGEFVPQELKDLKEPLVISLFDTVITDVGKGGGYYNDEDTLITEKRFLGTLKIPLSSVFCQGKIQGMFLLDTPQIVFGYAQKRPKKSMKREMSSFLSPGDLSFPHLSRANDLELQVQTKDNKDTRMLESALRLLITFDPLIILNDDQYIPNQSRESLELTSYAREWMSEAKKQKYCNQRYFHVLHPDPDGTASLVIRFLRNQEPPPECQSSLHQSAHFVSLIPFLSSWKALKAKTLNNTFWATSQMVLDLQASDWEGRAALLANYFLYILSKEREPLDVYLVFGRSVTEGKVVYVLTKTAASNYLWNPGTGQRFEENDEKCPLSNICLIVSPMNIYANIQQEGKPCLMDFNLADKSCWKPFFDQDVKPYPNKCSSLQESSLVYTEPNEEFAVDIEIEITDKVKASIRASRRVATSFNNDIGRRLRNIIDDLEHRKFNGLDSPHSSQYFSSIENLFRGKAIFGFPLHFTYSDVPTILERVKLTCIYENKHPDVEFAVTVRVIPYASGVFSVWVFLCSLVPEYV